MGRDSGRRGRAVNRWYTTCDCYCPVQRRPLSGVVPPACAGPDRSSRRPQWPKLESEPNSPRTGTKRAKPTLQSLRQSREYAKTGLNGLRREFAHAKIGDPKVELPERVRAGGSHELEKPPDVHTPPSTKTEIPK